LPATSPETKPFDYFLNLSAIKHVRTERDVYCLVRMIDTNVLFLHEFLSRNPLPLQESVFRVLGQGHQSGRT